MCLQFALLITFYLRFHRSMAIFASNFKNDFEFMLFSHKCAHDSDSFRLYFLFPLVTVQGSQTLTQNGSSFESASSIYSLARVENICEDAPTTTVEDTLAIPLPPAVKPSPSHSISSSSSGSFFNGKKVLKPASPLGSVVVIVQPSMASTSKTNAESISDDEKSEKRYSSSGYYESPHDDGKYYFN